MYESAIEAQPPFALTDADTRTLCMRYAALERRLGEVDRARAIFVHAARYLPPGSPLRNSCCADPTWLRRWPGSPTPPPLPMPRSLAHPRTEREFWAEWTAFEVKHGNEDTFRCGGRRAAAPNQRSIPA